MDDLALGYEEDWGMKIVICEKGSQAKNLQRALGGKYGRILPAEGHLLTLEEPEDVRPEWEKWSVDVLAPPNGLYGYKRTRQPRRAKKLKDIEIALTRASQVIVATDCDREGQSIADEMLLFFGYTGETQRAIFTSEDPKTLQEAFANLRPNASMRSSFESARARQQSDQIYGLSMTRSATTLLRQCGWVAQRAVGIGRVKTPTLGMICKREIEIARFVAQEYFDLAIRVRSSEGHQVILRHRPKPEVRIIDRAVAEAAVAEADASDVRLTVKGERKTQAPPRPFDLPTMQKAASAKWKWSAKKTLDTAQALYADAQLITYPRAETRYLPEAMIPDATLVLAALKGFEEFNGYELREPVIRNGKRGVYSTDALEGVSHHAVVPNANTAERFVEAAASLDGDQRKLFVLIARQFLASIGDNHVYDRTEIATPIAERMFAAVGKVTVVPGWTSLLQSTPAKGKADAVLPPVSDGEAGRVTGVKVEGKLTQAPPRYTEGTIIDAMQNVWRSVDQEPLKTILRDAKGIGTPATRDRTIEQLKKQELIETRNDGELAPTQSALKLYKTLVTGVPDMFDPIRTALLERDLDDIVMGKGALPDAVRKAVKMAGDDLSHLARILGGTDAPSFGAGRKPTSKMLKAAEHVAKAAGVAVPDEARTSFVACGDFLDKHGTKRGDGKATSNAPASDAQQRFVKKLLTDGLLDDGVDIDKLTRAAASKLIDRGKAAANAKRSRQPS